MGQENRIFVRLDVAKARHAVAMAEGCREGEVRFLREMAADPTAVRRMVTRLEKHGAPLHFCYEAGPTGHPSPPTRRRCQKRGSDDLIFPHIGGHL
jgi:hypothetical protein